MFDVHVECLAFQECLQIAIVLEDGVCGDLVDHALQSHASALDEVGVEAADCLLFGWRWDYDAWVVIVEAFVEPEEVFVSSGYGKGRGVVSFRGGACDDGVDGVGAGSVSNGMRITD